MTWEKVFLGVLLINAIIVGLFFIAFGQLTVKRLRRDQNTRTALGIEFISGGDIVSVAQALALPRSWTKKLETGPLSSLYAKTNLLLEHTTKFDRILAFMFYWLLMSTGLSFTVLAILNLVGFFVILSR
ncbi:MAG TPA: hypothetical protein VFX23_00485 [Limnobacter sp.]|uniref:hypothetical protein n=1 Tax=Limnobacter sp. TaxID=2003368 RepID=UPI002E335489|nr:hypothetical protein [Limnobacter sp.]HEX5484448.1 hypothetical protein [Limnobacter sp.]